MVLMLLWSVKMLSKNKFIVMNDTSTDYLETSKNSSSPLTDEVDELMGELEDLRISSETFKMKSLTVKNTLDDFFDTSLSEDTNTENDLDMLLLDDDDDDSDYDSDSNYEFIEGDKPITRKDKPIIKRDKLHTKIDKPDTLEKVGCMPCNVIIHKVPSNVEYKRKVLAEMIKERMHMLDVMNFKLFELMDETSISEKQNEFNILCSANQIKSNSRAMKRISRIYAVNIVMKNIRDVFGDRPCFRDISYDLISELGHNNNSITHYYDTVLKETMRVIWILQKEITVIQRLIQVNVRKYERVDEKDIKALDQAYAKIDRTVEYTRRIIIKLPYIIERM